MEDSTAAATSEAAAQQKQQQQMKVVTSKRLPPTVITVDTAAKQQQQQEEAASATATRDRRNDQSSQQKDHELSANEGRATATSTASASQSQHQAQGSDDVSAVAAAVVAAAVRQQRDETPPTTVESESRTPKHANKASAAQAQAAAHDRDSNLQQHNQQQQSAMAANTNVSSQQQQHGYPTAFFPPRIGGHTSGAFQPHDRMAGAHQQPPPHAPHQQQHATHQHVHGPPPHQQHPSQQQHSNRLLTLQLSPGTGRYYASFAGAPSNTRFASAGHPGAFEQQQQPRNLPPEYQQHSATAASITSAGPTLPYAQHTAQVSGMYPPPQQQQQYTQQGGYATAPPQRQPPHGWSQAPTGASYGRPPPYPSQAVLMAAAAAGGGPAGYVSNGTFSRAVSNSFDRSIKSRNSDDKMNLHSMETSPHLAAMPHPPPGAHVSSSSAHAPPAPGAHGGSQGQGTDGSVSDDGSWRQLNQIQSVDEEEMQKRLAKRTTPTEEKQNNPNSNSSSLTNSPTHDVENQKKGVTVSGSGNNLPGPPKMTSSLDSLSSVASAQEPLDTSKVTASGKMPSPSESTTGSLDLMKCGSTTSALLLPAHQRNHSHSQMPGVYDSAAMVGSKRGHEEARGDTETSAPTKDVRKDAPVEDPRVPKKGRMDTDPSTGGGAPDNKKASPLSIACSPPVGDRAPDAVTTTTYFRQPGNDSYYDKPPAYSYSMDSAPPLPMNSSHGAVPHDAYPPLPPHSHSSDSSTVTPMHLVGTAQDQSAQPLGVSQLPSWEIQGQESFGGGSQNGNPLMNTFSFSHDYPMLSGSNSGGSEPPPPTVHASAHHRQQQPELKSSVSAPMETRNQSFDGGHYHGSFSRAETMSFDSRSQGAPEPRQGYQGVYPPHAPSWGSAGSYPPPHQSSVSRSGYHPPPFRMPIHPAMMRTFSQDSGDPRSNFQPPSEFQAPPSNLNKARNRKEILSTPYVPSKTGVFGWTKEEDMRLTDIMKKYKNPRDWEPIAKELDRNRTAKECHERWIRYLKPGVRKGQWTDQEDAIVMEAVTGSKEQPFTRWSDLAQRLPGRVGKQIRDRWVNHLNPNINHLPFSRDDDLLLWSGHQKVGKRWVEIATKFFKSSRSENHIKNRWYSASFKKFIANEFGPHAYAGSKGGRSPKKESSKKKSSKQQQHPEARMDRGHYDRGHHHDRSLEETFHVAL